MCAILEEKRVGIAAVTVRIHSLSGIAPAPHITVRAYRLHSRSRGLLPSNCQL